MFHIQQAPKLPDWRALKGSNAENNFFATKIFVRVQGDGMQSFHSRDPCDACRLSMCR